MSQSHVPQHPPQLQRGRHRRQRCRVDVDLLSNTARGEDAPLPELQIDDLDILSASATLPALPQAAAAKLPTRTAKALSTSGSSAADVRDMATLTLTALRWAAKQSEHLAQLRMHAAEKMQEEQRRKASMQRDGFNPNAFTTVETLKRLQAEFDRANGLADDDAEDEEKKAAVMDESTRQLLQGEVREDDEDNDEDEVSGTSPSSSAAAAAVVRSRRVSMQQYGNDAPFSDWGQPPPPPDWGVTVTREDSEDTPLQHQSTHALLHEDDSVGGKLRSDDDEDDEAEMLLQSKMSYAYLRPLQHVTTTASFRQFVADVHGGEDRLRRQSENSSQQQRQAQLLQKRRKSKGAPETQVGAAFVSRRSSVVPPPPTMLLSRETSPTMRTVGGSEDSGSDTSSEASPVEHDAAAMTITLDPIAVQVASLDPTPEPAAAVSTTASQRLLPPRPPAGGGASQPPPLHRPSATANTIRIVRRSSSTTNANNTTINSTTATSANMLETPTGGGSSIDASPIPGSRSASLIPTASQLHLPSSTSWMLGPRPTSSFSSSFRPGGGGGGHAGDGSIFEMSVYSGNISTMHSQAQLMSPGSSKSAAALRRTYERRLQRQAMQRKRADEVRQAEETRMRRAYIDRINTTLAGALAGYSDLDLSSLLQSYDASNIPRYMVLHPLSEIVECSFENVPDCVRLKLIQHDAAAAVGWGATATHHHHSDGLLLNDSHGGGGRHMAQAAAAAMVSNSARLLNVAQSSRTANVSTVARHAVRSGHSGSPLGGGASSPGATRHVASSSGGGGGAVGTKHLFATVTAPRPPQTHASGMPSPQPPAPQTPASSRRRLSTPARGGGGRSPPSRDDSFFSSRVSRPGGDTSVVSSGPSVSATSPRVVSAAPVAAPVVDARWTDVMLALDDAVATAYASVAHNVQREAHDA